MGTAAARNRGFTSLRRFVTNDWDGYGHIAFMILRRTADNEFDLTIAYSA
jgi:hypothetical protein